MTNAQSSISFASFSVLSITIAACSAAPGAPEARGSALEAVSSACGGLQVDVCSSVGGGGASGWGAGSSGGGGHVHVQTNTSGSCTCQNLTDGVGPAGAGPTRCGTAYTPPASLSAFECTMGVWSEVERPPPAGSRDVHMPLKVDTRIWACSTDRIDAARAAGTLPSSIFGAPACNNTLQLALTGCETVSIGSRVNTSCVGAPISSEWTLVQDDSFGAGGDEPSGCPGLCPSPGPDQTADQGG